MNVIVDHAKSGGSHADLEELIPHVDAKYPAWMRKHYKRHFVFRENLFDKHEMGQWQKAHVDYLNTASPDPRRVIFIVDEEGNAGKSEIAHNHQFLFPNKTTFNLAPSTPEAMAMMLPEDGADIIFIDVPRKKACDMPYDFIEQCKNGEVISPKYGSDQKSFKKTHVVVYEQYPEDWSYNSL